MALCLCDALTPWGAPLLQQLHPRSVIMATAACAVVAGGMSITIAGGTSTGSRRDEHRRVERDKGQAPWHAEAAASQESCRVFSCRVPLDTHAFVHTPGEAAWENQAGG